MEHSGSYKMLIAEKAPYFELKGIDGKTHKLTDFNKQLLVIFFTCNHCPYAQAYEDRIIKLVEDYKGKVDFVAINSNDATKYPQDNFENMVKRAKVRTFNFSYLHDESQSVAMDYGAKVTPHFFVFNKNRDLEYQGRFDNSWDDEKKITRSEVRDAISALLKNFQVRYKVTNVLGCSIKWK